MGRFVQLLPPSRQPTDAREYFVYFDGYVESDVVILTDLDRYKYADYFEHPKKRRQVQQRKLPRVSLVLKLPWGHFHHLSSVW